MANGVGVISHGCSGAHDLSKRDAGYFASTTVLASLPPKLRVHGQKATVGQSIYVFDENATVGGVTPDSGTGRWILGGGGAGGARPPILVARNMTTGALGAYTRTDNTILADANGAIGAIDGVTNVVGDVLFLNTGAAAAADVGLYVIEAVGAAGAKFQMTRIPEFDSSAEVVPGTLVVVTEGTANADTLYVLNTNAPITLNTTSLAFTGLIRVRKLQLQITHADLTNAVNGAADTINIGAALPANAWVLGRPDVLLTTQFTGGSATEVDLDIGIAGAIKSLLGDLDVLASTASGAHYNIGDAAGTREGGYFGGSQLIATFTPDGSHDLLDLDAGDLTITVLYVVMA